MARFIARLAIASLLGCSQSTNSDPDAAQALPPDAPMGLADALAEADAQRSASVLRLNEVLKNPPGGDDDHEFVEVFGLPATDYSDHRILIVESDADTATSLGNLDLVLELGTTDAEGVFATPFVADAVPNGSISVLLVRGGGGLVVNTDLDTDDDGILDVPDIGETIDSVALIDNLDDIAYADLRLDDNADGVGDEYVGAARVPDGEGDWIRSNEEGDGLQGIPGASGEVCASCGETPAVSGRALLTPGDKNSVAP